MKALAPVLILAALSGCAIPMALPLALSAAGGAMTVLKDGFDIRLDLANMRAVEVAPPPATTIVPPPQAAPLSFQPVTMSPVWSPGDPR